MTTHDTLTQTDTENRGTMKTVLHAVVAFNWYRYFCLMLITAIVLLIGIIIGFQWGDSMLVNPIEFDASAPLTGGTP